MYSDFHFYIDFNWEDAVNKTLDVYLKELYQLVELAYQHKATVFYSQRHLDEFVNQMTDLDTDFAVSKGNKLQIIVENAKTQNNEFYAFELRFANENTTIRHINNVLSYVDKHDKIAVITHSNKTKDFLLVKSESDYGKIVCENITAPEDIVKWISVNRPRFFHVIKHGENARGSWKSNKGKDVSKLLCSEEDAQNLLNKAIPCFMEKDRHLYNFDFKHKTFIEFYFEGDNPQNQWHGFHIETSQWDKIPNYIRKYFGVE